MHLGTSYKLTEFLFWTRRQIYVLAVVGLVPVVLYQVFDLKWLTIPLSVVALLGTATSFIVGFKNVQTYNRTVEAQHIWVAIANGSRYWGLISRDFLAGPERARELVHRHVAWLTALRYALRSPRVWESADKVFNAEYQRHFRIPERETALEDELAKYLCAAEVAQVNAARDKPALVMSLQAQAVKRLLAADEISASFHMEFLRAIRECLDQQGRAERIKNFPYPRQYAIINTLFVRAFCLLFPFGLLKEFDKLNDGMTGIMQGHMIWLVVPFSVMVSWMYTALEQVGESTANPFEGGANDVPITAICRSVERDLREGLGETGLPPLPRPEHNIVL
jgi:putative membrane protein